MADVAHDASGPVLSEPAGIALQQVSQPASSDKGQLRVFISYSRDDLKFADQLDAALNACGFECLIDRHGISGGEDWKRRLGNLISEADTVVFVLSPSSARSEICDWEVEEAARLNKRVLPVNCRPLEGESPPPRLRELNYIFFYEEPKLPGSGFGTGLASLIAALNTDFDWLREHTRYLQRAIEWDTGGRPANRLLSGNDIYAAKAWAAGRPKSAPEPTALQLDFIRASEEEGRARLSEQRKQLEEIAAAQAARETALHDREEAVKQAADAQRRREEALKQVADAQRRRARIRNTALVVMSILVAVVGLAAAAAYRFAIDAEQNREMADNILEVESVEVTWFALLAKQFTEALTVAERAHSIFPKNLLIESRRAHALMFTGRADEAKALYLAHIGEPIRPRADNTLWERSIADDFADFREAGLTHPMMADVEKELGISR
jgi:hypothetical protein